MTSEPRSPRRVLRIIARLNVGGPAYHVSLLSGRLDAGSYRTLLATGSVGPGEAEFEGLAERYGAEVELVPSLGPEVRPRDDVRALSQIVRIMRRFRPDLVHTHTAKAGMIGRLAVEAARRPRPVTVHTYHGHVLEGYFGPFVSQAYRWIERALAMRTDCLVGVSQATVDDLVRHRVAPRAKFQVVPLGLDLDRFLDVRREDGQPFRDELGITAHEILVTYVGRLVPIKRVDLLLRAVAEARGRGAPLRLAVVGDGELRRELEDLRHRLGLTDTVHFVGFRTDLPAIAGGTDIAALTSDNEGTPVSLIEASAAARPAVATRVGGVSDVIVPQGGLTVPPGDANAFAAALTELAADAALRRRMGMCAREHVRGRYASDRLVRDITELYDGLFASRAGGRWDSGALVGPAPVASRP